MVFDWRAAKAYVGGIIAGAGPTVAGWIVGGFHAATGLTVPDPIQQTLVMGVSFVLGWVGVYFTRNRPM